MPALDFAQLVARSESLSDVLRHFGLENKGGNHRTLKARLAAEAIDISHIDLRPGVGLAQRNRASGASLEQVLVEGSTYSRFHLKRRLFLSGTLQNECAICGQGSSWMGRPLAMVLDHVNGVPNDNRIENLRMLCPNCNSQTATYCAKNYKKQV